MMKCFRQAFSGTGQKVAMLMPVPLGREFFVGFRNTVSTIPNEDDGRMKALIASMLSSVLYDLKKTLTYYSSVNEDGKREEFVM
jgi:hypothetical protein